MRRDRCLSLITGQESEDDLGTGKQVRSKVWCIDYDVFLNKVFYKMAFINTFVYNLIKWFDV